jgi:hypothetical protein
MSCGSLASPARALSPSRSISGRYPRHVAAAGIRRVLRACWLASDARVSRHQYLLYLASSRRPGRSSLARVQLSAFRRHQFAANSQLIVGRCLLAAERWLANTSGIGITPSRQAAVGSWAYGTTLGGRPLLVVTGATSRGYDEQDSKSFNPWDVASVGLKDFRRPRLPADGHAFGRVSC